MRVCTPPDPAQRRAFWRRMRLHLRWLYAQAYVLAHLGLLDRPGVISRWLSARMSELEHGLRCLLIMAPRPGAPAPDTRMPDAPPPAVTHHTHPPRARRKPRQLSMTLAAFGHTLPARPVPDHTRHRLTPDPIPDDITQLQALTGPDTLMRLSDRFDAMADIFVHPERHIQRMTARIALLGLRVRRHPSRIPSGLSPVLMIMPHTSAPARAVAFADTS